MCAVVIATYLVILYLYIVVSSAVIMNSDDARVILSRLHVFKTACILQLSIFAEKNSQAMFVC